MFPGFDKNRETGSVVGQTGNETKSEYFKNDSNDFFQTRPFYTFFRMYKSFATEKFVLVAQL